MNQRWSCPASFPEPEMDHLRQRCDLRDRVCRGRSADELASRVLRPEVSSDASPFLEQYQWSELAKERELPGETAQTPQNEYECCTWPPIFGWQSGRLSLLPLNLSMDDLFGREKYGNLTKALSEKNPRNLSYSLFRPINSS
jgi:hypothetical protein